MPGPRIIAPYMEVALSRGVTSEPIASCSSCTSINRLIFVSSDVTSDAVEDQGQFQGE